MSKHSRLFWDVILGSEVIGFYKPQPQAYVLACQRIGLSTDECMMVAAHNDDLSAASKVGMKTAFVLRTSEHGQNQKTDLQHKKNWTFISKNILDLADQLGCKRKVTFYGFYINCRHFNL